MRWRWLVADREVVLDWSFWTGRKQLSIDGQRAEMPGSVLATKTEVPLQLAGEPATLVFRLKALALASASLCVAGEQVPAAEAPNDVPWWTWPFVVAIAAIMVVTVGGALWGALVGVGAVSCIGASRLAWSASARLLLLVAITAACWGTLLLVRAQL